MSDPNNDPLRFLHLLWFPFAALCTFFWRQLQGKADKDSVDEKHRENKETLAYIREKLDEMGNTLTKVQVDVANLKGRGGFNGH